MSFSDRLLGYQSGSKIKGAKYGGDVGLLVDEWAKKTANNFIKTINKKNIKLTGELLNSFTYTVNSGSQPSITISFAAHGAFLDMKELFWHKTPPADVLKAWVKKVGISKFQYVPGYNSKFGMDEDKAASRIAWGIAYNRASGEGINQYSRWKREKVWQQPQLGKAVAHLAYLLQEELAAIASDAVITPLMKK